MALLVGVTLVAPRSGSNSTHRISILRWIMRPTHWTHQRSSFFKYMSSETARIVLARCNLRWSAPTRFNDPFDIQFDLHPEYGPGAISKTVDWMWNALHNRPDLRRIHLAGIPEEAIQRTLPRLSRDKFEREIGTIVREAHAEIPVLATETQMDLRGFFGRMLVLCLSEVGDNILMWSHYADMHQGVVLEFSCVPQMDSAWGVAEPVHYTSAMPRMFTEEFLTSQETELDDEMTMFRKVVYTKAIDWAYEREWRIVQIRSQPTPEYEDLPFDITELSAIRLGCRMPEQQRQAFIALAKGSFPNVRILQAHKAPREFSLRFDEIERS